MNIITFLRGCPAVGKSTFIKKHNLESHTVSTDNIRLLLGSPTWGLLEDKVTPATMTPFNNDDLVFEIAHKMVETRMKTGDMVVVDAQNIDSFSTKGFKDLAKKYGYRMNVVDFKDEFTLDEVLENNRNREEYKFVPENKIVKQYHRMQTENVKSSFNSIKPAEFEESLNWVSKDLNAYKKVQVFGDIHGCYTALSEVIKNGVLDKDTYYVFLGDFFDRGIENAEVFDFLFKNKGSDNFLMIRGNHEKHIFDFVRGTKVRSVAAKNNTIPEILRSGYSIKDMEKLTKKIQTFFAFNFLGQEYVCSHGGILEKQLNTVSKGVYAMMPLSQENIYKGLGGYEFDIDFEFYKEQKQKENPIVQFHGHRNIEQYSADEFPFIYNLEGAVEQGGFLRVAEITKKGIEVIYVKNKVFSKEYIETLVDIDLNNIEGKVILDTLRSSKLIKEGRFSKDISAFNFTTKAFRNKEWNKFTVTARGLFLDSDGKVMFRGYPKFFNLDENDNTTLKSIEENIEFPVKRLQKENGFLGILGYNPYTDSLEMVTKGGKSKHAGYFKSLLFKHFKNKFGNSNLVSEMDKLKENLKEQNATLTFEVIDIVKDPHIVIYEESKVVLLHAIKNDFSNTYFNDFCDAIAKQFGFEQPEFKVLDNMEDLISDIKVSKGLINNEGFVYEGANHYMFKLKTDEYNHYKYLRGVLDRYSKTPTSFKPEYFSKESPEIVEELAFLYEHVNFETIIDTSLIDIIKLFKANNVGWEKVDFDYGRKKAWLEAER